MEDRRRFERRGRERRILDRRSYDAEIDHEDRRIMKRRLRQRRALERRHKSRRDRPADSANQERVILRLPPELVEWFDKMAAMKKISRYELLGEALEEFRRNH